MDHIKMLLQLMAEGGEGGEGAAAGDNGQTPAGDEAAQEAAVQEEDPAKEFEELVKKGGKYADIFGQKMRDATMQGVKRGNRARERLNALTPALEMLAARYDVGVDDPKLIEMIANDKGLLSDKAMRNNLSEDQQWEIERGRADRRRAEDLMRQMQADQQMEQWRAEAEQLKQKYPSFDLDVEMQNPTFRQLLLGNVTMEGAIMALHHNEIIPAAMQYTAQEAKRQAAEEVARGQKRPRENGSGSQAAASTKVDISKMSRAEYKDYCKRIERGERISFG